MEFNTSFQNNGKLKLLIIVGTRPEIIRLAAVINKCRMYFDTILAHTGQNYDYNLNGVFFKDLKLDEPEVYLNAVGADLGETMGNIIAKSYQLMVEIKPDAVLVLGDTNSCLSVIGAKRLKFVAHLGIAMQFGSLALGALIALVMMLMGSFTQITPSLVIIYQIIFGGFTMLVQNIIKRP